MKEGGTILGGQGEPPDSSSGAFEDIKPRYYSGRCSKSKLSQVMFSVGSFEVCATKTIGVLTFDTISQQ